LQGPGGNQTVLTRGQLVVYGSKRWFSKGGALGRWLAMKP
jgi:hypothetical protein